LVTDDEGGALELGPADGGEYGKRSGAGGGIGQEFVGMGPGFQRFTGAARGAAVAAQIFGGVPFQPAGDALGLPVSVFGEGAGEVVVPVLGFGVAPEQ
jgi:hypothetical protein